MKTLYIVPTPLGNLEDVTLRALRILKEVRLIAAEDTRTSRKLLDHFEIQTPMISYHEHNKLARLDVIIETLEEGDVALISDAGTPGISDPGFELVQEAIAAGITVVPLPGATAITTALVASGLPTDSFLYLGFPPRKHEALRNFLNEIIDLRYTLIFYESPNRLVETLMAMQEVFGDRQGVVARELTKYYEEFQRDKLSNLITYYTDNPPKGEIVLLVAGNIRPTEEAWDEAQVRAAMEKLLAEGVKRSAAAKIVADRSGWDRRIIYDMQF